MMALFTFTVILTQCGKKNPKAGKAADNKNTGSKNEKPPPAATSAASNNTAPGTAPKADAPADDGNYEELAVPQ
ncbi:unnamed protein product [Caenorhabditis bovis]|uniref:Uncharacterized protein n=1 Tax=Caenorhabditis bovis TaxID=2654633 RepID=A0A8S1FBG3_9PELO|nr:unnamed protein product [Caenorhabditis bovis]